MAIFDDDQPVKKVKVHTIGEDLSRLSAGELSERIGQLKAEIARILKDEGYISNFKLSEDGKQGLLRVYLKYGPGMERVITDIQRVSRPGCRIYCGKNELPRVSGGLGINVLSTSRGLMTDRAARKAGVGGELLCEVW